MKSPNISVHARRQAATLLEQTAEAMSRAGKASRAEEVHALRTSVRRFEQCLKTFEQFYHGKKARKILRQLKDVMDQAAEARDRDVALVILKKAGLRSSDDLVLKLSEERRGARNELSRSLERHMGRHFSKRWKRALDV